MPANSAEYGRRYRADNRERLLAGKKLYYIQHRQERLAYQGEYQRKNRPARREYELKRNYGLAAGEYERLAKEQGGRCAICSLERKLFVDHDHETGRVRGLLCHHCNAALGHLSEAPEVVAALADYLVVHCGKNPYRKERLQ